MPSLLSSFAVLAAALPLASCGGKGGGTFARPSDVSTDLLTRQHDAQRSVVVHDGVAYLFLSSIGGYDEGDDAIALPECWTSGEDPATCNKTEPLTDDVRGRFADVPATLTVLGVDGPCAAQVGTPVMVNTSGCEPSGMVAAPLSGCSTDVAPVGRIDDSFDHELRWRPAPAVKEVPLFADPAAIADPVHRDLVKRWLAEDELEAGTPRDGKTADVRIDAGAEQLESVVAGFLVGDGESECDWQIGGRQVVGLRRGGALTPLDVPAEWDGAIVWRGRVVGVASGLPRDTRLHAIGGDGSTTVAFENTVWWDNEECTQGGWAAVEYPCGP